MSINMPAISKNTFTRSIITAGFVDMLTIPFATIAGILKYFKTYPNIADIDITAIIEASKRVLAKPDDLLEVHVVIYEYSNK